MKRVVAAVVLVIFISSCVARVENQYSSRDHAPAAPPSKQPGDVIVIDAEKREQLDLFPEIEGFEEARLTVANSGGYDMEVKISGDRFSGINEDAVAVAVLCDYIANFEEYRESRQTFEKKWKIVDYDDLGFPITSYEVTKTRGRVLPYLFGGGCLLLGALPIALLTMVIGGGSPSGGGNMNWTAGSIVIAGGAAASIALGAMIGNKISNHGAVERIRESRKLKPE